MSSKSVSQIFKTLPQTGDINIFVIRGVFFSDEKYISSEIWDTLW